MHASLLAASLARGPAAAAPPTPPVTPSSGSSLSDPTKPAGDESSTSDQTQPTAPTEDPQARVGALINEGQALFDTADFIGAIDRWTAAYAGLPDDPHLAAARNLLAYQIAQAHIEAHAMDHQTSHLRKAERLLRQYIAALDPSESEARADAEQRLAAVEAQIEATTPPWAAPGTSTAEPPAPVVAVPPPRDPRARGPLLLSGGIGLGLGAALLAGTAVAAVSSARVDDERRLARERDAGMAELDRLDAREARLNRATIATAIAGGVLLATGVALVVKASVKPRTLTAQPMLAPGLIGARLSLRF